MNAVEHYREAERLRDAAREAKDGVGTSAWEWASYFNAAAQVHATLALVGAPMAYGDDGAELYAAAVVGQS